MRILHIIATVDLRSGGPIQGLINLIPLLVKNSIEIEVLSLDNEDIQFDTLEKVKWNRIGEGKTRYNYNGKLLNWLKVNLDRFNFVSIHGIWQYQNYAVYRAVKHLKKFNKKYPKIVIMPHGMLDPYFQKSPERRLKALRNEIIWRIFERKAINSADALFFTCEEELLLARTTFKGYKPQKEFNVGYGIKEPPIYTKEMQLAFEEICPEIKGKDYMLFLSRIHPKKGIFELVRAYEKLKREVPDLPELVVAGPINSKYSKKIEALASKIEGIHMPGMLTDDSKWGAIYGCKIYVLPSYQENFGIAIVEAMACRKPVLITKNINIWKEIEEGNGGWIMDEVNIEDIKNNLTKINCMPVEEITKIGENSNAIFATKFNVFTYFQNFYNQVNNLL